MQTTRNTDQSDIQALPRVPSDKIVTLDEACNYATQCRAEGKTVVFANGCFDILHGGHVSYLNDARVEGDVLVVGINSDASERALKVDLARLAARRSCERHRLHGRDRPRARHHRRIGHPGGHHGRPQG